MKGSGNTKELYMDEVKEIITAYYKPLRKYFIGKKTPASTDVEHVENNIEIFSQLKPYFEKYLIGVWEQFFEYSNQFGFKHPWVGVFIDQGLMSSMHKNIHNYILREDISKERFLLQYADLFEKLVVEEGYEVIIQRDKDDKGKTFAYAYNFIKGDPKFGDSYYTAKKEKELTQHFYDLIKQEV